MLPPGAPSDADSSTNSSVPPVDRCVRDDTSEASPLSNSVVAASASTQLTSELVDVEFTGSITTTARPPHGVLQKRLEDTFVDDADAIGLTFLVFRCGIGAVMLAHGVSHSIEGGEIEGTAS
mgnify:CR=1 FL=1|jgi:hypothetical protein